MERRIGKNCYCRRSNADQELGKEAVFRADAAFAKMELGAISYLGGKTGVY